MFGITVKKWFFDLWDNMLLHLALNLGTVLLFFAITIGLAPLVGSISIIAGKVTFYLGIVIVYVYLVLVNGISWRMSNGVDLSAAHIPSYFSNGLVPGLIFGILNVVFIIVMQIALPFYWNMNNVIGTALLLLIFWAGMYWLLMSQYYLPLNTQSDKQVSLLLKKSSLVFIDNAAFTLAMGIGSLIILAVSFFTLGFFPGISGLLLWQQTALKLRARKYEWTDEHPDATNKTIPWKQVLADEYKQYSNRDVRSMLFPWKGN